MTKRLEKRQTRFSKNIEEIYSVSPSVLSKIRYYLTVPNIRLQLTFKNSTLDNDMQEELGKTLLGKGCKLPHNENQIEPKFNRYKWDLKIIHGKIFKQRLNQYKKKHQDIDINEYGINSALRVAQFVLYVIASIAAVLNVFDHANNLWHFI